MVEIAAGGMHVLLHCLQLPAQRVLSAVGVCSDVLRFNRRRGGVNRDANITFDQHFMFQGGYRSGEKTTEVSRRSSHACSEEG